MYSNVRKTTEYIMLCNALSKFVQNPNEVKKKPKVTVKALINLGYQYSCFKNYFW